MKVVEIIGLTLNIYLCCEMLRAETQDGGDAKVEASPRDIIYSQPAEPHENERPTVLHKLDLRYGYAYKLFYPYHVLILFSSSISICTYILTVLLNFAFRHLFLIKQWLK